MAECWTKRGCDTQMRERCPHAESAAEKCPMRCQYGRCTSPRHATPADPLSFLDPDLDRSGVLKEQCLYCAHFLTNGPRMAGEGA